MQSIQGKLTTNYFANALFFLIMKTPITYALLLPFSFFLCFLFLLYFLFVFCFF
jgi:hypothetical protein